MNHEEQDPNAILISREEAAKRLAMSLRSLSRLIASGDIPFVRIGGMIRFRVITLNDFVAAREVRINPRKQKRKAGRPAKDRKDPI